MEQSFYKGRLTDNFGIEVIVPEPEQRQVVHDIIYFELCLGKIINDSRQQYLEIINYLYEQWAEAVILGCTEIALLVQQNQTKVPLYDTTEIHSVQVVQLAISDD